MYFNKIGAKEPLNNKLLLLFLWTVALMLCAGGERMGQRAANRSAGGRHLADTVPHPSDVLAHGGAR